jgi:hypothetical protein
VADAMISVPTAPASSLEVRDRLVDALKLDLVGPWAGHAFAEERLPGWVRPSNWYLTGFLIPSGTPPERSADADEDDDLGEIPESAGLAEESSASSICSVCSASSRRTCVGSASLRASPKPRRLASIRGGRLL